MITQEMDINESIFRAYDIRGKYPAEVNEGVAAEIAGFIFREILPKGKIVLAKDPRKSSSAIYKAVEAVLKGRDVVKCGPATTPMFYNVVVKRKAAGGIMITASHNPPEWNGMKIVGRNAGPISGWDIAVAMKKNKAL